MNNDYAITFTWDEESRVWIATSADVRGLVLEHESFDALVQEVCFAVPELLQFENKLNSDISLVFSVCRQERLACSG